MTWSAKAQLDKPRVPPAPLVAIAGWILPGAGYWLLGQKARALVIGITIVCLWLMGLAVGGVRIIEVPKFDDHGRYIGPPDYRRDPNNPNRVYRVGGATFVEELRDKPWSIAQVLAGPVAIVSGTFSIHAARPAEGELESRVPIPHARLWEISVLYTAVAGMLNLIALIDAAHRARHAEESA